jgi:hypothetical protein
MAANKQLLISESRGDLNWCTPCRGNLTNIPHASHIWSWDHTYLMRSTHSKLLWNHQQRWTEPLLLRKWALNPIYSMTADRSAGPYLVLSQDSHWRSGGKASLCWWQATRLIRPISLACDQYVQYLFAGANPSVLNRHRRGLHSLTFPTDGPPLSI